MPANQITAFQRQLGKIVRSPDFARNYTPSEQIEIREAFKQIIGQLSDHQSAVDQQQIAETLGNEEQRNAAISEAMREDMGVVGKATGGLARGIFRLPTFAARSGAFVSQLAGAEGVAKRLSQYADDTDYDVAQLFPPAGADEGFGIKVLESAGENLPTMLATGLGTQALMSKAAPALNFLGPKALKAAEIGGTALGMSVPEVYSEATQRDELGNVVLPEHPGRVLPGALLHAGVETGFGLTPVSLVTKGKGQILKGLFAKDFVKRVSRFNKKYGPGKTAILVAKRIFADTPLGDAIGEGFEEVLQNPISLITKHLANNDISTALTKSAEEIFKPGYLEELWEEFSVGAGVGALYSGGKIAIDKIDNKIQDHKTSIAEKQELARAKELIQIEDQSRQQFQQIENQALLQLPYTSDSSTILPDGSPFTDGPDDTGSGGAGRRALNVTSILPDGTLVYGEGDARLDSPALVDQQMLPSPTETGQLPMPMSPVELGRQYLDAFNRGDQPSAAALRDYAISRGSQALAPKAITQPEHLQFPEVTEPPTAPRVKVEVPKEGNYQRGSEAYVSGITIPRENRTLIRGNSEAATRLEKKLPQQQPNVTLPPKRNTKKPQKVSSIREVYEAATDQADKGRKVWHDIRKVTPDEAKRLSEATGLDIDENTVHMIDADAVRHAFNEHGKASEAARGQVPITSEDLEKIPDVLSKYDKVEKLPEKNAAGNDVIQYQKRINGHIFFLEEYRAGRNKLALATMWKKKTPSAQQHTSETSRPRKSPLESAEGASTSNIPTSQPEVKAGKVDGLQTKIESIEKAKARVNAQKATPPSIKKERIDKLNRKLAPLYEELEKAKAERLKTSESDRKAVEEYKGATIYRNTTTVGGSFVFKVKIDGRYLMSRNDGGVALTGNRSYASDFIDRERAEAAVNTWNEAEEYSARQASPKSDEPVKQSSSSIAVEKKDGVFIAYDNNGNRYWDTTREAAITKVERANAAPSDVPAAISTYRVEPYQGGFRILNPKGTQHSWHTSRQSAEEKAAGLNGSMIAKPEDKEPKRWYVDADDMPVFTTKSDAMGYRGPFSRVEIEELTGLDPSTLTEKNYGKEATLARREQAKAGAVVRPSSVDTPAQGSLASAQAAKKAPSEALKKPVVKWFVNYTEQESSQRTTETKPFDTLAEAKEFAKGKRGYITKHEDYARGGISTDKASASFVEYFGGFQPSAQEGQTIKQITGKDAPAPAKPQPAAKSAIGKLAKRISQFIDELKGKNLTPEQQGIYNVFTRKEKVYKIKDLKAVGEYVTVEGGRRKFGAQHVMIKHYGTNIAPVTAEEILQIGDIIRGGKVDFEENARVYIRTAEDGATLKVVVGKSTKDGSDTLITFHSQNRKAPTRATRESSALQGASQKADTSATSNIPSKQPLVKGERSDAVTEQQSKYYRQQELPKSALTKTVLTTQSMMVSERGDVSDGKFIVLGKYTPAALKRGAQSKKYHSHKLNETTVDALLKSIRTEGILPLEYLFSIDKQLYRDGTTAELKNLKPRPFEKHTSFKQRQAALKKAIREADAYVIMQAIVGEQAKYVAINEKYYNYLKKLFPDSDIKISTKTGEIGVAFFEKNGTVQALVMPITETPISDNEISTIAQSFSQKPANISSKQPLVKGDKHRLNKAYDTFIEQLGKLGGARAHQFLLKNTRAGGKVTTRREFIEKLYLDGVLETSTVEVPKLKGPSDRAWNRMNNQEQERIMRDIKQAGTKTVYRVEDPEDPNAYYAFGKFGYDYANFLNNLPSTESESVNKSKLDRQEKADLERIAEKQPQVKGVAQAKTDKIEDFGEVLHGARKHYAQEFADNLAKSGDLEAQPFSKSWPEPDYQKLIDSGMPEQTVAMLRALRDSVPTRPRSSWKMNRWLAEAKKHKLFAEKMIAGEISHKDTARYFDEPELSKLIDLALLYDYVGHNISLKGAVIYSADYFNRDGKRLDVPEHLFAVSMPTTTANRLSNWRDNEVGLGKSKAEAIENFKKNLPDFIARRTGAAKKRATQFLVYQRTRGDDTGTFFIAYKTGSKVVELKSGFKTSKEAREFRDNNRPELEAILNNKREVKPERRLTNQPRTGKVRRTGDVSPQQFTETFGFRGVQFGNWVEGDRRQTDLNEAYDALTDLADVLDIPAKALSLDGALGLAFGARGKGGKNAYAAHYEPDTVVINLTKTKGAGSLAHEWWHALDNYFGGQGKFATVARLGGSARAEVKSAFNKLVAIIDGSSMPERSKRRDATRSKPYWSTDVEMSARAFESFILAKLSDAEISNDFLVNVVSEEAYDNVNEDYPYLLKSEIPTVKDAFTALFQTMKHEKTDKGVKLYSVEHLVADYAAKGLKQAAKIVRAGLNLMHSGAKTFAQWARQMVNEFGQNIKKHLRGLYKDLSDFNARLGRRGSISFKDTGSKTEIITLKSVSEMTDEDFTNPTRSIILPSLPDNTLKIIGSEKKPVLIKQNILEKNRGNHKELSPEDSRRVLNAALYDGELAINDKPSSKGNYWVLVKIGDKNGTVVVDTQQTKDNTEVVGWRLVDENGLNKVKKRALREGGQFLITKGETQGAADRLSALPQDSSTIKDTPSAKNVKADEAADIEARAKADGTWLKAPNGKPSKLNARQWVQVRTQAFKNWFGDWESDPNNASKVVDENGEPMVVYHGATGGDFSVFDKDFIGQKRYGDYGRGFYFTEFSGSASRYVEDPASLKANARVIPVFLAIKNPIKVEYVVGWADTGAVARAKEQGKDGVFVPGGGGLSEVVAIYPNQIKSATANIGTFSKTDPNILYSVEHLAAKYAAKGLKKSGQIIKRGLELIKHSGQTFAKWARQMVNEFGQTIKKHLRSLHKDLIRLNARLGRRGAITLPSGTTRQTGSFGPIFEEYRGKPKEAVQKLIEEKTGEVPGALHHKDVGDIDLVWGKEGTGKSDGYGLAKIAKFHPEVVGNLQGILSEMDVTSKNDNRIQLESKEYQAAVRLTWNEQKKNWLLTEFKKEEAHTKKRTDTLDTSAKMARGDSPAQASTNKDTSSAEKVKGGKKASELKRYATSRDFVWRKVDKNTYELDLTDPNTGETSAVETIRRVAGSENLWNADNLTDFDHPDTTGGTFANLKTAKAAMKVHARDAFNQKNRHENGLISDKIKDEKAAKAREKAREKDRKRDEREAKQRAERMRKAQEYIDEGSKKPETAPEKPKTWRDYAKNFIEQIEVAFFDTWSPVRRLQEAIQKKHNLTEMPENIDLYQKLEIAAGKVEAGTRIFKEKHLEPIVKYLVENKIAYKDFNRFLAIMHAEERNQAVAERNPTFALTGAPGSGISNETAAKEIEAHKKNGTFDAYMKAAEMTYELNNRLLDEQVKYGLLSQKQRDAYRRYQYYTPMKSPPDQGLVLDRTALGRRSEATDQLAYINAAIETVFRRGTRRETVAAAIDLFEKFPDTKLYRKFDPPKVQYIDKNGKVRLRVDRNRLYNTPNVIWLKDSNSGETKAFEIKDERLASAINRQHTGSAVEQKAFRAFAAANRYLAATATSLNPEFIYTNLMRDVQQGAAFIGVTLPEGSVKKFVTNLARARQAITDARNGKVTNDTQLLEQFQLAGGQTGYSEFSKLETSARNLAKEIEEAQKGGKLFKTKEGLRKIRGWIENWNDAIETRTRFAGYLTAKDAGLSTQRSAALAKNMTVNFNKKGAWAPVLNSLYLFSSANLGGGMVTARIVAKAWQTSKGKKVILGAIGLGFLLEFLNRSIAGDDDDEGVNYYDKVPDYIKDANYVFMIPGSKGKYLAVLMPYGLNALPALGRNMAASMFGSQSFATGMGNVVNAAWDSFNPLGGDNRSLTAQVVPSAVRPFFDLATNTTWTGRKIRPDQPAFGSKIATSELYNKDTSEILQNITGFLNEISGGNRYTEGYISWSPADIEHLIESYTGGVGKFISRGADSSYRLAKGELPELGNIPIARRYLGGATDYNTYQSFKENIELISDFERARRERNTDWLKRNRWLLRALPLKKMADKQIGYLNKRQDLTDKERREKTTLIQKSFNKRFGELSEKHLSTN